MNNLQKPFVIFIIGHPATGKTRLGSTLSQNLKVPFLPKDALKERMFDTLGSKDKAWSLKVSAAAHRVTDYVVDQLLQTGNSVILESNFKPEIDDPRFQALRRKYDFTALQILCWADGDVIFKRFMARQNSKERHQGHVEEISEDEIRESFVGGKCPVLTNVDKTIEIDTTDFAKVDYDAIVKQVQEFVLDQA